MMRSFQVTLTDKTVAYNLLSLLLATSGAVPTDGYFPNPCMILDIVVNGSGAFTITDSLGYGIAGQIGFHREVGGNRLDLGQWKVQGDTDTMTLGVCLEAT